MTRTLLTAIFLTLFSQTAWAESIKLLCHDLEPDKFSSSSSERPTNMLDLLDTLTEKFDGLNSAIGKSYSGPSDRPYFLLTLDVENGFFGSRHKGKEDYPYLGVGSFKVNAGEINYQLIAEVPQKKQVVINIRRITGYVRVYAYSWSKEEEDWKVAPNEEWTGLKYVPMKMSCRKYTAAQRQF